MNNCGFASRSYLRNRSLGCARDDGVGVRDDSVALEMGDDIRKTGKIYWKRERNNEDIVDSG